MSFGRREVAYMAEQKPEGGRVSRDGAMPWRCDAVLVQLG